MKEYIYVINMYRYTHIIIKNINSLANIVVHARLMTAIFRSDGWLFLFFLSCITCIWNIF